jgi:hypothetical protein
MRAGLGKAVLAAAAVAGSLIGRPARGQAPVPLDLSWSAPPGCPGEGSVGGAVARLLEGSSQSGSRVRVDAVVTQRAGGWTLTLTTTRDGAVGHRAMKADSCAAVADAAALIIALAIDPVHVVEPATVAAGSAPPPPPPPPPSPPAMPPIVAPAPPAPPTVAAPRPPPPPRARPIALGVALAGDVGSLPAPAYGIEVSAAWVLRRLRLEAYAAYWPAQTATVSLPGVFGTLSADVYLADGGVLGCYAVVATPRWRLEPCAALELGALGASGSGLGVSTPGASFWAAARVDARATLRIADRVALVGGLGVAVPLNRQPMTETGPGANGPSTVTVFETGSVAGRAVVGPELRF